MKTFKIVTDAGPVSATLNRPEKPVCSLLFAHGAGADHRHAHMEALADAFCAAGCATMRFNFPFKEAGRHRVDAKAVSVSVIVNAAQELRNRVELPMLIGGHSYGGRMATHALAEGKLSCVGMILCSFPLHPAGKPSTERAAHLPQITAPMLFLSGTRDALASDELLQPCVNNLGKPHRLHWLDTADHSFKILKRSRKSAQSVYAEAGEVVRSFVREVV